MISPSPVLFGSGEGVDRMGKTNLRDIRGVRFEPPAKPLRVVSLVPSWTETLFYLGLTGKEIAGRTRYCIHPRGRVEAIETIGGPMDPDLGRIFELAPNLIIGDLEENRREDVDALDMYWIPSRVFVTGPRTVVQALEDMEKLGILLHGKQRARVLGEKVRSLLSRLVRVDRGTAAYIVWQDPLMAASRETYIGDILRILGYRNVVDRGSLETRGAEFQARYPTLPIPVLVDLRPDVILLSTEPFPFRREHAERLRSHIREVDPEYARRVDIRIVNGEYFSWYGYGMVRAFTYFVTHQRERSSPDSSI